MTNNDFKELIQFVLSCIVLIATVALVYWATAIDPRGEVHDSILMVVGELLAFVAGVWGIAAFTTTQIHKINRHVSEKSRKLGNNNEEDPNDEE